MFGTVESQLCDHGCVPDRVMSQRESLLLMADVFEIAGLSDRAAVIRRSWAPENVARTEALLREGRAMFDADVAAARAAVARVVGRRPG